MTATMDSMGKQPGKSQEGKTHTQIRHMGSIIYPTTYWLFDFPAALKESWSVRDPLVQSFALQGAGIARLQRAE